MMLNFLNGCGIWILLAYVRLLTATFPVTQGINLHLGVFHPKVAFTTSRHIKAERGCCREGIVFSGRDLIVELSLSV